MIFTGGLESKKADSLDGNPLNSYVEISLLASLCKKTPTTAPKKNRGKLLFSFLKQLSRSGFWKVFMLKTNKKHNRDSLDSKTSKAPEKNRGRHCIWRFLIKD